MDAEYLCAVCGRASGATVVELRRQERVIVALTRWRSLRCTSCGLLRLPAARSVRSADVKVAEAGMDSRPERRDDRPAAQSAEDFDSLISKIRRAEESKRRVGPAVGRKDHRQ